MLKDQPNTKVSFLWNCLHTIYSTVSPYALKHFKSKLWMHHCQQITHFVQFHMLKEAIQKEYDHKWECILGIAHITSMINNFGNMKIYSYELRCKHVQKYHFKDHFFAAWIRLIKFVCGQYEIPQDSRILIHQKRRSGPGTALNWIN